MQKNKYRTIAPVLRHLEQGKFIETESRMVVTRDPGEEELVFHDWRGSAGEDTVMVNGTDWYT